MSEDNVPRSVRAAARSFRRQRAKYYEYMASILEASKGGMKILDLFEKEAARYENQPRGVLAAYWTQVYSENGSNLAATWQGTLPDDEVGIIRIAQDAGDGALLSALRDISRIAQLTDKVKSAVWGTLAAAIFGIAIAAFMLTVFPMISSDKLRESYSFIPLDRWGVKGQALVNHAERMKSIGLYILIVLGMGFVYVQWTINNTIGPIREWLDRKVVLYRTVRDIKGALFLSTMATLTRRRGNVMFTLRESLSTFAMSSRSPWLRWRVEQIIEGIDQTGAVGTDAFNTNLLSQEMFYYLRDTQEARGFSEGFEETGKYVEGIVISNVLGRMTIYRWALLLLAVAAVVGVMGWQFAVIYEMKGAMQSYYTSG